MTHVISFISRKGGTGKTTNAIHTATTLASRGHRVVLLETDPNYTLNTLRQLEAATAADASFSIHGTDDHRVVDEIEQQRDAYDFVVVDSAGKTTDEAIRRLCLASDLIVVPTSLTRNDVLVAYQTIEDLKPARELNERLRIVVLPTRINSRTLPHTIRKALENLDADLVPTVVPQKNVFNNFSTLAPTPEYSSVADALLKMLRR